MPAYLDQNVVSEYVGTEEDRVLSRLLVLVPLLGSREGAQLGHRVRAAGGNHEYTPQAAEHITNQ